MTIAATPYPLQWPPDRPRKQPGRRKPGQFKVALPGALGRVQEELDRIGAKYAVVSTNVERRVDGSFRAISYVTDPGVAVYFQLAGKPTCLPCDTYMLVEHNIAAIAAHIAATRSIERHGVATVADMFRGFAQLSAPAKRARPWWEVLGLYREASPAVIEAAFRDKAKVAHPDRPGGSTEAMTELTAAREAALAERKGS